MAHEALAVASIKPHNEESNKVDTLIPDQLRGTASNLIGLLKDYYDYMNIDGVPTKLSVFSQDEDASELAFDDLEKSEAHLGIHAMGFIPSAYNQEYTQLTPKELRDSGLTASVAYRGISRPEFYIMKLTGKREVLTDTYVMAHLINGKVSIDFYDSEWVTYPQGSPDDVFQIKWRGNRNETTGENKGIGLGYDPKDGLNTGTPDAFTAGKTDPIPLISPEITLREATVKFKSIPTIGGHGKGLTVDLDIVRGQVIDVRVADAGHGYHVDDYLEIDLLYNSALIVVSEVTAGPSNVVRKILAQHDIDKTTSDYITKIQGEIAKGIPDALSLDKNTLYKKIVEYYNTRGSEISVQSFFKIFFDEVAKIQYPKEVLFKPSSAAYTGSSVVSPTAEKYFYKKGNLGDTDQRIEFLVNNTYKNEKIGTYFIDFEFGDDFKKGVSAPTGYSGNEAAAYPFTMLFSGSNTQYAAKGNFRNKKLFQDAGVKLKIDSNNDLIITGRFGFFNSDFSHTIQNYVTGTGDFPFQEVANKPYKRIRLALSIDVTNPLPGYETTQTSGGFVVSNATNSNYNGTYTLNTSNNRWEKGTYYFEKEVDGIWSFNYSSNKRKASYATDFPWQANWGGTFIGTQNWAFDTSGVTTGSGRYSLGRVRLTTSNFGTTNNSPHDSINETNNDISLTVNATSDTSKVNLWPGCLGRIWWTGNSGSFNQKDRTRVDENPDGEIYYYGFTYVPRFCTDAEVKAYSNQGILPTDSLIDIDFDNGGSVNFTNKGQNRIIAKNVVGYLDFGKNYSDPFKETNYGLSSTGTAYPRNVSWKNEKGFLSNINKIHDGRYYQEFSYVIKTALSQDRWEDAFTKLIHPAGLKFFTALTLELYSFIGKINPKTKLPDPLQPMALPRPKKERSELISDGIREWLDEYTFPRGTHSPKWQFGWFEYLAARLLEIIVYENRSAFSDHEQANINRNGNIYYDHEHGLRIREPLENNGKTLHGNPQKANLNSFKELSYDQKYIELDGNATAIKTGADIDRDSIIELTFKCLEDGDVAKGKYIAGTKWTGTDGFERELSIKQIENAPGRPNKQVEVTVTDNGANEITGTLVSNDIKGIEVTAETFDRRSGEFGIRFNDTTIDCEATGVLGNNTLNGIFQHSSSVSGQVASTSEPGTNLRGHHLFTFDRATNVVNRIWYDGTTDGGSGGSAHFDTYGEDAQATQLANKINLIADGKIVILVSYDASRCNSNLRAALVGCGAEDERSIWGRARVGHAFIGIKGATSGAVERIETNLGGLKGTPNEDGQPLIRVTAQYTTTTFNGGAFYPINKQPKFKAKPVVVPLFSHGFTTIRVQGNGVVERMDPLFGVESLISFRSEDETDSKFYNELAYGIEDYRHRLSNSQPTKRVGNKFLKAILQYRHVPESATRPSTEFARGIEIEVENFTLNPRYKAYVFTQYLDPNNNYDIVNIEKTEITSNGTFEAMSFYNYSVGTVIGFVGITIEGQNATPDQISDLGSFDVTKFQTKIDQENVFTGTRQFLFSNIRYVREGILSSNQYYNDFDGYMNIFNLTADDKEGSFVTGGDWGRPDLEIEELTYGGILGNYTDPLVKSFRFKPNSNAAGSAITRYDDSPNAGNDPSRASDFAFWVKVGKKFSGGLGYNENGILPDSEKGPGGIFTLGLNRDINLQNKTPIDKFAEYEVSVTLKSLIQQEGANNRIYIGVQSLDENGLPIQTDSENSYNYGVAQNYLMSNNEEKTFTGKFKGFNPRTIVREGGETISDPFDPLKFAFAFGFAGGEFDVLTNTHNLNSSNDEFADFGGFGMVTSHSGGPNTGLYDETPNIVEILEDKPLTFRGAGKITFKASLAPGNTEPTPVTFKFERKSFPNTDPSFFTESVIIDSTELKEYTVNIPAQVNLDVNEDGTTDVTQLLTYEHVVMYIGEPNPANQLEIKGLPDRPIILTDATIFDDRVEALGEAIFTNDNRFDPGAAFFNVVILTNHHNNNEREKVYTSLYNGPNGAQAIDPHIPSTLIRNIRIKRTDGKAIKDDKVDRQHQMHGVKQIHNSALPLANLPDPNKNNIKVNTLAIGTVNQNKSFIGVHSFNDSPATTNLLQTNFDYPWTVGSNFIGINGFGSFGTEIPTSFIDTVDIGETTVIVLEGTHGYLGGETITISDADGLSALNGKHKILNIGERDKVTNQNNALTLELDTSQSFNDYKSLTAKVPGFVQPTGFTAHDQDKAEVITIYDKTPWGTTDVIARTKNLDFKGSNVDVPKQIDNGAVIGYGDERKDGGFRTGMITPTNISDDHRLSFYFKFNKKAGGRLYFGTNAQDSNGNEVGLGAPRNANIGGRDLPIIKVDKITDAQATDDQKAGIYLHIDTAKSILSRNLVRITGSTLFSGAAEYYTGSPLKIDDEEGLRYRIPLFKDSALTQPLTTTDITETWDGKGRLTILGARNPYFLSEAASSKIYDEGRWYLAVGHILGKGGVNEQKGKPSSQHAKFRNIEDEDGIYDVETGKKVKSAITRQFVGNVSSFSMRAFIWGDQAPLSLQEPISEENPGPPASDAELTAESTSIDFFEPRIEVVNGLEPTLDELLNKRPESSYPSKIQVQEAFIGGSELGQQDCKYLLTESDQVGNSLSKLTTIPTRFAAQAEIYNTPAVFTGAKVQNTLENTIGKLGTTGELLLGTSIDNTREFTGNPYTPDFGNAFAESNGGIKKFANFTKVSAEFGPLANRVFTVRSDQWSSTMNSPNGPAGAGVGAEFELKFIPSGANIFASVNPVKPGLNFRQGEVIKINDAAFRPTQSGNINGLYFVVDAIGKGNITSNGALAAESGINELKLSEPIALTRDKAFSRNLIFTPTKDFVNDDYYWETEKEYEIVFDAEKLNDRNKPANLYIGAGDKIGYYKNLAGVALGTSSGNPNARIETKGANADGDGPWDYTFTSAAEGKCRIYIAVLDAEGGMQVAHNGHVLRPALSGESQCKVRRSKAPFDYNGGSTKLKSVPDSDDNTNQEAKAGDNAFEMVEYVFESEYLAIGDNTIQIWQNTIDGVTGGYIKVIPNNGLITAGSNTHTLYMKEGTINPTILIDHKIDRKAHRFTGEDTDKISNDNLNFALKEKVKEEETLYEYNWNLTNLKVREKRKRIYEGNFQAIVANAENMPFKESGNNSSKRFGKGPRNSDTEENPGPYRAVDVLSIDACDRFISHGGAASVPALDKFDTPADVGQRFVAQKAELGLPKVPELGVPKGKYGVLKFTASNSFTTHYLSLGEELPERTFQSGKGYEISGSVFIPSSNSKIDHVFVMAGVNPYLTDDKGVKLFDTEGRPRYRHPVGRTQIFDSPSGIRGFDSYSRLPTTIDTKGSWVTFNHKFVVPELFEDEPKPVIRFVTTLKDENMKLLGRHHDSPSSVIRGYTGNVDGEYFYIKDIVIRENFYSEPTIDKDSVDSKYHTAINYADDISLELDFNSPTLSDAAIVGFDLKHANTENFYELRHNNNSTLGNFSLANLPFYESNLLAVHLPFVAQKDDTPVATLNPLLTTSLFSHNTSNPETLTRLGTTPFGSRVVLVAHNNDTTIPAGVGAASQRDGGFRTTAVPVNPKKTYRVSMWVKAKNTDYSSNSPEVTTGENANEGGVKVIRWVGFNDADVAQPAENVTNSATITSEPTFIEDFDFGKHDTFDSPAAGYTKGLNNNKWFLFVAHIRGFGDVANVTTNLPDSGIYIPSHDGRKIRELETNNPASTAYNDTPIHGDWRFSPGITKIAIEAFVKRNARSADDEVEFFAPRIDEINGSEPSIAELTSGKIIEKANLEDFDKKIAITTWNNPIADTELAIGDYVHTIQGDDFNVSMNNVKYKNDSPEGDELREVYYADAIKSSFKSIVGVEDTIIQVYNASGTRPITLPIKASGTLNLTVDWGDGSSDFISAETDAALAHTYDAGYYTIRVKGDFQGFDTESTTVASDAGGSASYGIIWWQEGVMSIKVGKTTLSHLRLQNCMILGDFAISPGLTDTSGLTSLAQAFKESRPGVVDFTGFDTSNVTTMEEMFYSTGGSYSNQVNPIGLHKLDISSVTTMERMMWPNGYNGITESGDNMPREELSRCYLAWANNTYGTTPSNITFSAGNTQYIKGDEKNSPNDASPTELVVEARNYLINTKGWTISDAGLYT